MSDSTLVLRVTSGAYEGRYEVDPMRDFTATEYGAFRQAVGTPMEVGFQGGVGLDVLAGMVWLVARRRSKGLAYPAVADTLTWANLEMGDAEAPAEEDASPEA